MEKLSKLWFWSFLSFQTAFVYFLRVSGGWPHPEEVLSSDPGPSRWSFQWYLVISGAGASPVQPSMFSIILSNQENCTDFQSQDLSWEGKKKIIQACVCGLWRPNWWSVICQSDFYKSNLCLNWTDQWHERRAVLWSQAFCQIQAGHANIDNVCSLSPGSCPAKKHKLNCESSKPVQFLMVLTEVMSTELFKNSETGYSEISIIPVTHVTYTTCSTL